MTKAKAQTLLARGKKVAAWAGIGTAVLVFVTQGWSLVQTVRESAKKEQIRDDRLSNVEKQLDTLNNKFDTYLFKRSSIEAPHLTFGPIEPVNGGSP